MPAMAKRNWISNRNRNHGRHSGTNPDTSGGRSVIHRAIPAPNDRYRSIYTPIMTHHSEQSRPECRNDPQAVIPFPVNAPVRPDSIDHRPCHLVTRTDGKKEYWQELNVVMPNLSPREQREKYTLYDNKAAFGAEAAEGLRALAQQLETIGYRISTDRGDYH